MNALKPCPFCGADAVFRDDWGDVQCGNPKCAAMPRFYVGHPKAYPEAIALWNRRAMPEAVRRVCEEMAEEEEFSVVRDWAKRIREAYDG